MHISESASPMQETIQADLAKVVERRAEVQVAPADVLPSIEQIASETDLEIRRTEDKWLQEYKELMSNYRTYFGLAATGMSIYMIIVGGCLSLPYTLKVDPSVFRLFALIVTIGGIAAYSLASCVFFRMHFRLKFLCGKMKFQNPETWLMPVIMCIAIAATILILLLILTSGFPATIPLPVPTQG